MKYFIIGLCAIIIGLGTGGYVWYQQQLQPVDAAAEPVYVDITSGMSSSAIADLLAERGIIRDATAFRLSARLNGLSDQIQAGFYALSPGSPVMDILQTLTNGNVAARAVRIPGGVTLADIKKLLQAEGFTAAEINTALDADYDLSVLADKPAKANLEGYLFPDTYHLPSAAGAEELVRMILANTDQRLDDRLRRAWRAQGLNIHEALTLASIVQKEAADAQEQAQVAQVFLSRLARDQRLESDPTYLYAARLSGQPASPELRSPYNTYRIKALPPGPIASIELPALEAVANPAKTDFLYFVTGRDSQTRFSKTVAEHQALIDRHGVMGAN